MMAPKIDGSSETGAMSVVDAHGKDAVKLLKLVHKHKTNSIENSFLPWTGERLSYMRTGLSK